MYLCFCWCFVPLWAHSIPTSTAARSRRLGCCLSVLPRPCVRAAAAFASRSGLASGRVLGEWRTHHCVVEIKSLFLFHIPTCHRSELTGRQESPASSTYKARSCLEQWKACTRESSAISACVSGESHGDGYAARAPNGVRGSIHG